MISLFALAAVIIGIALIIANNAMTEKEQKEFDQDFGETARRGGIRRICKQF